jgi:TPR repeat protein
MSNDAQDALEQFDQARARFAENMKAFTCKGTGTDVDDELVKNALSYMLERNFEKAIPAFEKAANQGHMGAQYALGEILYDPTDASGKKLYEFKNEKKAIYWLKKAAEQGHPDAANDLGTRYNDGGLFVRKNKTKAKYWYKRGEKLGSASARRNLYQNGLSFTDPLLIFLSIVVGIVIGVLVLNLCAMIFAGFFGFIRVVIFLVGFIVGCIIMRILRIKL